MTITMTMFAAVLRSTCGHSNSCNNKHVPGVEVLTWGLVSIGLGGYVHFLLPIFGSCDLSHTADLRHAEFGVVEEKHAPLQDGELVFGPIPELPQVLIVQCIKRVIPRTEHTRLHEHIFTVSVVHCAAMCLYLVRMKPHIWFWGILTRGNYHSETFWKGHSFRF